MLRGGANTHISCYGGEACDPLGDHLRGRAGSTTGALRRGHCGSPRPGSRPGRESSCFVETRIASRAGPRLADGRTYRAPVEAAREARCAVHLDGARRTTRPVRTRNRAAVGWGAPRDSVTILLLEGLGLPDARHPRRLSRRDRTRREARLSEGALPPVGLLDAGPRRTRLTSKSNGSRTTTPGARRLAEGIGLDPMPKSRRFRSDAGSRGDGMLRRRRPGCAR